MNRDVSTLELSLQPSNGSNAQRVNTVRAKHERRERGPHKEATKVPTADIIHLISNTPPRCEAIRHSATTRSTKGHAFLYVMSTIGTIQHTRCSIKSVAIPFQRSLDDWPTCGFQPESGFISVFCTLQCTTGCPTTSNGL